MSRRSRPSSKISHRQQCADLGSVMDARLRDHCASLRLTAQCRKGERSLSPTLASKFPNLTMSETGQGPKQTDETWAGVNQAPKRVMPLSLSASVHQARHAKQKAKAAAAAAIFRLCSTAQNIEREDREGEGGDLLCCLLAARVSISNSGLADFNLSLFFRRLTSHAVVDDRDSFRTSDLEWVSGM